MKLPFTAFVHNSQIVKRAEQSIGALAECENTIIYLKNPDGTTIRIQPGCKLLFAQLLGGDNKNEYCS